MTRQLGRPDWGKEALAGQRRWGKGRKEGGRERERVREREKERKRERDIGSQKFQTNPIVRPWFAGSAMYIYAIFARKEIDLAHDMADWQKLSENEQHFIKHVLVSCHPKIWSFWTIVIFAYSEDVSLTKGSGGLYYRSSDCSCWLPFLDVLQWDHLRSASPAIPCGCCSFDPHELGNSNRDAFQSIHGVPLWWFYRFVAILVGLI